MALASVGAAVHPYRAEAVDVVAVVAGGDGADNDAAPGVWLDDAGWRADAAADTRDGDVAAAFGVDDPPMVVVVDGDGDVVSLGPSPTPLPQFDALVWSVLRPTPPPGG